MILFPAGSLPAPSPIDSRKALLLLDFQNDFVSPEGKLPVSNVNSFFAKLPSLVKQFRTKGTVIWARTEFVESRATYSSETASYGILLHQCLRPPEHEATGESVTYDPEGFLASLPTSDKSRPCLPRSWGAEYPEDLARILDKNKDTEVVKSQYSAFNGTSLLLQLRMTLVTHIYVCGSLSNVSVYATVLDAVRHGIEVTLIEDCLGYITEACHIEAVHQMVDSMGAGGVDFNELMDDLAGLLGDVVREEDFSTRFQVSIPSAPPGGFSRIKGPQPPPPPTTPPPRSEGKYQTVEEWRAKVWPDEPKPSDSITEADRILPKTKRESPSAADESSHHYKSWKRNSRQGTPESSPPRKRSTSDLEDISDESVANSLRKTSARPSPSQTKSAEGTRQKIQKARVRRVRPSQEPSTRPKLPTPRAGMPHTQSTGDLPDTAILPDDTSHAASTPSPPQPRAERKAKKLKTAPVLERADTIGTGDSSLHTSILPPHLADQHFIRLRTHVTWQKMYHRTGEVPRLVAVQGQRTAEGDIPIYRHPADESPALLPFDETVQHLRAEAQKTVGHNLNHVLIQWYRNGEDSISEHSDKTADIVRGSKIVNFSLGARRTMTLRTKKPEQAPKEGGGSGGGSSERETRRIHLPHNSIFVLGEETNRYWLHAIRADKRPEVEKDAAEKAFEGERISLTFRNIGTFLNEKDGTIWGQGAKSKTKKRAGRLLQGEEAEAEGEAMIIAFGKENHLSASFDWHAVYGRGFDVVNFETKKV